MGKMMGWLIGENLNQILEELEQVTEVLANSS